MDLRLRHLQLSAAKSILFHIQTVYSRSILCLSVRAMHMCELGAFPSPPQQLLKLIPDCLQCKMKEFGRDTLTEIDI